ncbi:MAG TPA: 2'-5' RNA ligase family protein [Fodinibius sp.]|nr:2'-5' RNA ligase family protein [Fodinibius sp.]
MSEPSTYSLWLQPNGDIIYRLQKYIKKLSTKYNTPVFEPHITLLGGLKSSETELLSLTNTLASSLHPFELQLTKADYTDRFYQALFIRIKENAPLKEARSLACRLFDCGQADKYMPHVSLLYGDLSRNEKERILNIIGREFYTTFSVKSLALIKSDGRPKEWKKIETVVF